VISGQQPGTLKHPQLPRGGVVASLTAGCQRHRPLTHIFLLVVVDRRCAFSTFQITLETSGNCAVTLFRQTPALANAAIQIMIVDDFWRKGFILFVSDLQLIALTFKVAFLCRFALCTYY
jgi:hypothetical protein